MSKSKADIETEKAEKAEAIGRLKELGVKPGSRVYTKVTHVAKSGMSRSIACYLAVIDSAGEPDIYPITHLVARVLGRNVDQNHDGVVCGGCGMDMTFEVVYNLGSVLFPEGGPLEKSNKRGPRDAPYESNGGYLLNRVNL